jgi:hypothetical protein
MLFAYYRALTTAVLFAVVCSIITPSYGSEEAVRLPRRVVLALDGVGYSDMRRLQLGGAFGTYFPVSRNVSTFPSLSDIAWGDIFRTSPPDGYQRFHYSIGQNRIVGGTFSDLLQPVEHERRMHIAFESLPHHVHSYMYSEKAAQKEIDQIVEKVLSENGSDTFYAYMLSTDTLQHTDGDIDALLRLLDRKLFALQVRYLALTGRRLEIALISDHGNNHQTSGVRVPIKEFLEDNGYSVANRVEAEKDVVYTAAGILTSVALFSRESQVVPLARLLSRLEGVDVVTYVDPDDSFSVRILGPDGTEARVRKMAGESRYSYEALVGDPIAYLPVLERLSGRIDDRGFVDGEDWLEVSSAEKFPVAPERIYRGHHSITKNPARILVSLKDGYENANPTVKFLTKFKRRGGTHGGLSEASSNGIVMSNYRKTRDLTTQRVSAFLGFTPLRNYRQVTSGAEFVDSRVIGYDLKSGTAVDEIDNLAPYREYFVNLWDPNTSKFAKMGIGTIFLFEASRDQMTGRVMSRVELEAASLPHTPDGTEFRVCLETVLRKRLSTGDWRLKISAIRYDAVNGKRLSRDKIFTARFFVDLDGRLIAH